MNFRSVSRPFVDPTAYGTLELPASNGKRAAQLGPYRWPMSKLTHFIARSALIATLLLLGFAAAAASSQEPLPVQTLAIFADRPISEDQWQALVAALDRERTIHASETGVVSAPRVQILRGDRIPVGLPVESSISLYLHGNCALPTHATPSHPPLIHGALGWVMRRNGHIEPFAHVDCTLLGQLLVCRSAFLTADQRSLAMPTAIARVALHEWIHIASQSPSHTRQGIAKAEFSVDDLVAPRRITLAQAAPDSGHQGTGLR